MNNGTASVGAARLDLPPRVAGEDCGPVGGPCTPLYASWLHVWYAMRLRLSYNSDSRCRRDR